jgi:hypothetical protein
MQTVYNLFDMPFQSEKVHKKESFRITSRDMDMLEFILEMKFSTIEDIHSKFFRFTKLGEQSSCLRWARERVSNLVRSDFLKVVKDVCHRTLYVVTTKGYLYLRNSRPETQYSKPLQSVGNSDCLETYKADRALRIFSSRIWWRQQTRSRRIYDSSKLDKNSASW